MTAYLLRRLLWMVPTILGILMINFGIIRLQSPPTAQAVDSAGDGGEGGQLNMEQQGQIIENALIRFRRTGRDLPALMNTRGFTTKESVTRTLLQIGGEEGNLKPSDRRQMEMDLWMSGPLLVEPLQEIVEDPELEALHAPALNALSYTAYVPLIEGDLRTYSAEQRTAIENRNHILQENRIEVELKRDGGYLVYADDITPNRLAILDIVEEDAERFDRSGSRAYTALFLETGFVDFFYKLFTMNLTSELKKENVFNLIGERWQISFGLNIASIILAWLVSIPLGIRSARKAGSLEDRTTTSALFAMWSLPSFFVGTVLLVHLCTDSSVGWRIFPNKGLSSPGSEWYSGFGLLMDIAWHAVLPLVVLTYSSFTALSRYMRGSLLDNLSADYARTARAKGCSEDSVVYRHVLPNSMVTMITMGSGLLSELFGGFLFVEVIFSIPGLGTLMLDAALNNDAPLLMASSLVSVLLLLVSILIADILYAVVDPRIRSRYG